MSQQQHKPLITITESSNNEISQIMEDFTVLYHSGALSDFSVIVGTTTVKLHKSILAARCSYFKDLFTKNPDIKQLNLPDVDPIHFKVLTDYIYTAKLAGITKENALTVLKLASRFSIKRVRDQCVTVAKELVTRDNLFSILEECKKNKYDDLHRICVQYLEVNASDLFGRKSFFEISRDTLISLLQSDKIQLPELEIFLRVIEWGKYQLKKNEKLVPKPKANNKGVTKETENDSLQPKLSISERDDENSKESISIQEKVKQVIDYTHDAEYTQKLKLTLADILSHIRFPLLTAHELYDYVEPSKVVKKELLLEAYRSYALSSRTDYFSPRLKIREGSLFYVSGVRENVPMEALKGWTLCYHKPYSDPTSERVFELVKGARVLIGAKQKGSKTLALCAMGLRSKVFKETHDNNTVKENDVYWYHFKNHSFGFSATPDIVLGSADLLEGRLRLSWHLTGRGGYRLGDIKNCKIIASINTNHTNSEQFG